jgi:Ca-activated chloride channel family protein
MDALSFDHPRLLQSLWALPVLWALYMWGFAKKRQALECFATPNLFETLIPSMSVARQQVKAVLVVASGGMLAVAMAGPRWGTQRQDVPLRGVEIIFVLDVSNSMLAEDVVPNRLQRAKLDIDEMLGVLRGDRVGLVTFAGSSTLTCPLTLNYGSFRHALEAAGMGSTPRGGTNIGDAVRKAADAFSGDLRDHKAVIVISDGDETDDSYAVEASQAALAERGIRVFTVGLGDVAEGTRIPLGRGGGSGYLEYRGQEVRTKLEPALLQAMAAVADGACFLNPDFRAVYDTLRSKVAPREFRATGRETRYARFHWFAGAALVLLLIETLTTNRKAVMA